MNAFFQDSRNRCSLLDAAASWQGTPWMAYGAARGLGVSSRMLVRMLYQEAGWNPIGIQWDSGLRAARGWEPIAEWLRKCPWFGPAERIEPGDLLVRFGSGAQFGVAIPDPARLSESHCFVQCVQPTGVTATKLGDSEFMSGLKMVLRPLSEPRS